LWSLFAVQVHWVRRGTKFGKGPIRNHYFPFGSIKPTFLLTTDVLTE
jgi:hypothetical protein